MDLGNVRSTYNASRRVSVSPTQALLDRDKITFEVPFYYDFTELTTSNTTTDGELLKTLSIPMFDGITLNCLLDAWCTPASPGFVRLVSGANEGAWVQINATSQTIMTAAASVVIDTSGALELYGRVGVGTNTLHVLSASSLTWWGS